MENQSNPLTLEKLEIHKRLASLEAKFEIIIELKKGEREASTTMCNRLEEHIERLDHLLIGNGTPGALGRILKIEDHIEASKQNGKIAKTALAGVIIKFFWDFFFHSR